MFLTAHSGCDNTPENSIEFVKYAIANGADALEVDVRFVKDKLSISHDATTQKSPLLSDVFEIIAAHDTVKINCDMKQKNLELCVYELAKEYRLYDRVIYSGDVSPNNMTDDMKNIVEVHYNIEQVVKDAKESYKTTPNFDVTCASLMIKACKKHGFEVVNANYEMVTSDFQRMLKAENIAINCWTVNDLEVAKKLMQMGVNSVTTGILKEMKTFTHRGLPTT